MTRRRDVPGPGAATDEDYSIDFGAADCSPEETAANAATSARANAEFRALMRQLREEQAAQPPGFYRWSSARQRAWRNRYRAAQEAAR